MHRQAAVSLPSKINLFRNPEKTRVLWHDLKVFPTAINLCIESLFSGTYGKISGQVSNLLLSLQTEAVTSLLLIENISILQKTELKSLQLKPEKTNVAELIQHGQSLLESLLKEKKLKIKMEARQEADLKIDARYGGTVFQNLLFLAQYFSLSEQKINIFLKSNQVVFEVITGEKNASLKKKLGTDQIFSPGQSAESLPALMCFNLIYLSQKMKQNFKFSIHKNLLTFEYEQNNR